jgi:hypothetical protein
MTRLSTLSNPTGLKDLDRKLVGIVIDDRGATPAYSLIRLDLADVSLPPQTHVVVIARRGNAEIRVDHGAVTDWNKGFVDASELGTDGVWIFRVLLVLPNSPKLLAAIENVRPQGLGNSESLIALEPADLGHVPWEFIVLELDGRGVIRFNREVYANSSAAEADAKFACLVFPEAIRQLAAWHTQHVGALAEAHWEPFKAWLTMHGITDEPLDDDSPEEMDRWCRSVVSEFCARNRFADVLRGQMIIGGEE